MKNLLPFLSYLLFNLIILAGSELFVARYVGLTWKEFNHHGLFLILQATSIALLCAIYPLLMRHSWWVHRTAIFIFGTVVTLFLAGILLAVYEGASTFSDYLRGGCTLLYLGLFFGFIPIVVLIGINLLLGKFFFSSKSGNI